MQPLKITELFAIKIPSIPTGTLFIIDLQHHNLSSEDIRRIILHKGQNKNSQPFWAEICMSGII
jgi:hypothetical protein